MGTAPSLETVAVIGAGDLGNGMARLVALGGLHVRLYDRSADSLRRAVEHIRQGVLRATDQGRISPAQRQSILDGVLATADMEEAVAGSQLVVDAAPDLLALKRQLFADIARFGAEATLATLSALPLAEVARAAPRPELVVGLRLADPVEESDRIEIVSLPTTDLAALDRVRLLAARIGWKAVVLRDRWVP